MKRVELKSIYKNYDGQTQVIQDISVAIEPGEFFVLVGPSGCGKSTMLRMIAGLEDVSSGELLIGEKSANNLPPSERDLSMVFQNYALYPHLTVEQNIMFGLHTKKISKQEQRSRCLEAAKMLGLTDFLKRKPRHLSGGQRQRVALARAIVTHSPICLMDEPLSNLDAKLRAKMRSEIRQIQRKLGITMIYVTHDQTEAMTMADRMMILHNGVVQQVGKPLDIYNHPQNTFVAGFIGSPPMNLSKARVAPSELKLGNEWSLPSPTGYTPLPQNEVIVGIRPENIRLAQKGQSHIVGQVVNVEILGTETLLTIEIDREIQWTAKWNGQWNIQIGEKIPLQIREEDVTLFSPESGICIHSQAERTIEGVFV